MVMFAGLLAVVGCGSDGMDPSGAAGGGAAGVAGAAGSGAGSSSGGAVGTGATSSSGGAAGGGASPGGGAGGSDAGAGGGGTAGSGGASAGSGGASAGSGGTPASGGSVGVGGTASGGGSSNLVQEYRLNRPLLQSKPNALLAGEDWQGMTQTSQLNGYGFRINPFAVNTSGKNADASKVNVPYTPGAKRAEIVSDPTFGYTARLWQTDTSDGDSNTVEFGRSWAGVDSAWLRVLVKFQKGFTTAGPGTGANAWKMIFGPDERSWVWTNTSQMQMNIYVTYGTQQGLPNDDGQGFAYSQSSEWSSEEWWEYIVFSERVSSSHYRKRFWTRALTVNGQIVSKPSNATWHRRWGIQQVNASVPTGTCNHVQLGVNRNKAMYQGDVQWWKWGPWEVIDASLIPDPYGLASDML